MKKLILAIAILLATYGFAGDPAAILSEKVTIHIDADGKVEKTVEQRMSLDNFRALRMAGEWFYSFNPKLEKVEILKSVTVQKDGTRIPAPDNAILDQTPEDVMNAPDFSGIREKMVSHTGLEPGCVVEFAYKITDIQPHRMGLLEPMGGYFPIKEKTVSVSSDREIQVRVNGNMIKKTGSEYTIRSCPAILTGHLFTSIHEAPFIYIQLDDPVAALKTSLNSPALLIQATGLAQSLDLSPDSSDVAVETALDHLLNKRLDTITLDPELVDWTPRPLIQIMASGYATEQEKVMLAHAVLTTYKIPHTVNLVTPSLAQMPVLQNPDFTLSASTLHIFSHHSGGQSFLLYGTEQVTRENTCHVRIVLEENEPGQFTGTISADATGSHADFSLTAINPLDGAEISNETTALKTGNRVAKTGDITYTIKDGQIQLTPMIRDRFQLKNLENDLVKNTSLTLPEGMEASIQIIFNMKKEQTFNTIPALRANNRFGSSSCQWQVDGKKLNITQKLAMGPATVTSRDFALVNDILVPVMTETSMVGFLR